MTILACTYIMELPLGNPDSRLTRSTSPPHTVRISKVLLCTPLSETALLSWRFHGLARLSFWQATWLIKMKVSMGQQQEKTKVFEQKKKFSKCPFDHLWCHTDWTEIKTKPLWWKESSKGTTFENWCATLCVCVHVRLYTVYIYTHIRIYKHTYTHTHKHVFVCVKVGRW